MSWSMKQIRDMMAGVASEAESYAKNAHEWDPVVAKIADQHGVGHISSSSWGGLYIYQTGTVKDLAAIWKELRLLGYKTEYPETTTENEPGREIKFTKVVEGMVVAQATIHFSSTICKKVQVGTQLKEVPVYEVKCGEPEPEVAASEPLPGEVAPPPKSDGHTEDPIPF